MNYYFEDFTEENYKQLLLLAKSKWKFIDFGDFQEKGNVCLWRHDVDFSVHRARQLAQIESDHGIKSTYFLLLHSNFYNLLDLEIRELIISIRDLGHSIGLHFDPHYYVDQLRSGAQIADLIAFEAEFLQKTFQVEVQVFSLHNPDVGEWLKLDQNEVAGRVNVYGKYFRETFKYISDSNGYWRFDRLHHILERGTDEKLQVLTHPGWWVPTEMSPRQRIQRCITGRAMKAEMEYDRFLDLHGRVNVY